MAVTGIAFAENGYETAETLEKANGSEYARIAERGTGTKSADNDEEETPVQDESGSENGQVYRGGKNN